MANAHEQILETFRRFFPIDDMHPYDNLLMSNEIYGIIEDAEEDAFERGNEEGYIIGKEDAYDSGYDSGYEQGHTDGYDECRSDVLTAIGS